MSNILTHTVRFIPAAAVAALALAAPAVAAPIVVPVDVSDYGLAENLGITDTDTARVGSGGGGADAGGRNAVFVFPLPVLGTGVTVETANLDFTYDSRTPTAGAFNGDLWAIGTPNSTTRLTEFLEADAETGAANRADNVKIQDNILVASTSTGPVSTNADGDTLLTGYLNGFYGANPAYAGGNFIFLRLNPDNGSGGTTARGFNVGQFAATGDVASNNAVLTITPTVIPEPTSVGLAAAGLLGLLARRRR